MEVILLSAHSLGEAGQIVRVANGYAKNYLFPKRIAVVANEANKQNVEDRKLSLQKASDELFTEAQALHAEISNYQAPTFIKQAADDNKLFGSVTKRDIATVIAAQYPRFTHESVVLNNPLKYTGIYKVLLSLHHKLPKIELLINIARSEQEATNAKNKFLAEQQEV
jgi:large subunit ribosomal protein L9